MTSIYKTAYPYYSSRKKIDKQIIINDYRLSHQEVVDIKRNHPDNHKAQLTYALLLMTFKNLNYFPDLSIVPKEIVEYIQEQLSITCKEPGFCHPSTISRYRKKIYKYFNVTPWAYNKTLNDGEVLYPVKQFTQTAVLEAAKVHNFPADIINTVIEQLKNRSFEFPTFNQLDRIARSAKESINQKIFDDTFRSLSEKQLKVLDDLLKTRDEYNRSDFNTLKAKPQSATISNFRSLVKTHDWLFSLGDISTNLNHIIPIKLKQFAAQARSLDASDLKDFSPSKRYTLILCLLHNTQSQAKDSLAIMLCRTINNMHKKGKAKLDELRELYRLKTQELLVAFSSMLYAINPDDQQGTMDNTQSVLDEHGGISLLKENCEQAIALNGNNHLPFMLKSYQSKRNTLLNLLEIIEIKSTTNESQLTDAIAYILQMRILTKVNGDSTDRERDKNHDDAGSIFYS